MITTVFDAEANGFLDVADRVWCIAATTERGGKVLFTPADIKDGLDYLHQSDILTGHNIKGYDLPLFKKVYGWEPLPHQAIVDTLIMSRMLMPKRENPAGYVGNKPHSLEAWGYRVGMSKPEHTDWSQYSEAMGNRCIWDVKINKAVLKELERETGSISDHYEQLKPNQNPLVRATSS